MQDGDMAWCDAGILRGETAPWLLWASSELLAAGLSAVSDLLGELLRAASEQIAAELRGCRVPWKAPVCPK